MRTGLYYMRTGPYYMRTGLFYMRTGLYYMRSGLYYDAQGIFAFSLAMHALNHSVLAESQDLPGSLRLSHPVCRRSFVFNLNMDVFDRRYG